jgi:hypothetical protein
VIHKRAIFDPSKYNDAGFTRACPNLLPQGLRALTGSAVRGPAR